MECPNCSFVSPPGMLYCGQCGTKLGQACEVCGKDSPLDFLFCGHCGSRFPAGPSSKTRGVDPAARRRSKSGTRPSPLQPVSQAATGTNGDRRQATVLIADVKGSTLILEQIGGEAWVDVMKQALQIMGHAVNRFGGIVDQFRGDGMVAFFGAPHAHEDDPERAVLAALIMQNELQTLSTQLEERYEIDLLVRVGINTGEVITSSISNTPEAFEDTTMGEALTLAARLEAAAEPGTVLVSESTHRLVSASFNWQPLGEMMFKGLRNPVPVYRPLEPISDHEQQQRLQTHGLWTPLVGRDSEIKKLEKAIEALRNGKGSIALISGEAGMGKSRLLFEVRQRVEREDALMGSEHPPVIWLQGRCRSYEQTQPYSMWVDMWQRWLGIGPDTSEKDILDKLRGKSREFWGDRYADFYPYLATILALPLEPEYQGELQQLDADGLRRQFFIAVRSWLEIMSQRAPLVLVFTEAHWANDTSLDLLRFCLSLSLQERCLFTLVSRPEENSKIWTFKQWIEAEYGSGQHAIDLGPLDRSQCQVLIERMIGAGALPDTIQNQLIKNSDGNPFYLTELIHGLVDSGRLVRDHKTGAWKTEQEDIPLDLPDSLKSLLLSRIDRLSADERRLLQIAAVIGPVFWFDILNAFSDSIPALPMHLAALQRAQLIAERGRVPGLGREFTFNSALIREAVYENMLRSQRKDLHFEIALLFAKTVEAGGLGQFHSIAAHHFSQAGDCRLDLKHSMQAAAFFSQIRANQEAIESFQHALSLLRADTGGDCTEPGQNARHLAIEVLQSLGRVQFGIGEVREAEILFREAISIGRESALPPKSLVRLFHWLGDVLYWKNAFTESVRLGEEGLHLLEGDFESPEAALMNQLIAVGSYQLGDHDKFVDYTLRTAGFLQRLPYTEELRPAFDHIISLYAYTWKNISEALRWLEILREKAEALPDLRALGEYYEYSAVLSFQEGKLAKTFEMHEKAIEKFSHIGDAKHESRAWKSLGTSRLQNGEVDRALACFDKALETAKVFGNEVDYAQGFWNKGQALFCKGQTEEAMANIIKARQVVQQSTFLREEWSLSGLGRVYLANGDRKKALESFQQALQGAAGAFIRNTYQANEILSGLELSHEKPETFHQEVEVFRRDHPEVHRSPLQGWYLDPIDDKGREGPPVFHDGFQDSLQPGWRWQDPYDDCSFVVRDRLEIQAGNERNLHRINRSAPRLLRNEPVSGDFTIQTTCREVEPGRPAIGGLLVWLSEQYWFCLEIGGRGAGNINLRGYHNNTDFVFSRGLMVTDRISLRLERKNQRLSAFCSPDGQAWYSAGGCELTSIEPLYLGLHAIGHINRVIYPGAFKRGSAIRFEDFALWT